VESAPVAESAPEQAAFVFKSTALTMATPEVTSTETNAAQTETNATPANSHSNPFAAMIEVLKSVAVTPAAVRTEPDSSPIEFKTSFEDLTPEQQLCAALFHFFPKDS
jgi:hypothetical protein